MAGRLPSDQAGRPIKASGVGKNSERTDLQKTPGLRDSDLQQGDVQAMEEGQRIAPIQEQAPAAPAPTGRSQRQVQREQTSTTPGIDELIKQRLGGSIDRPGEVRTPREQYLADNMKDFLSQLSRNPKASPVTKMKARQQLEQQRNMTQNSRSRVNDLGQIDNFIQGL